MAIAQTVKWILCTVLLGVCSRESDIDRNKAAEPMDDLEITRDVAYAPGDRHGLDIYAPRGPGERRPVAIYLYGGAWASGAKADYAWVGAALARRGYVAIVPDYRVYPQGLWPMFLEDNAAAVRWSKDHAANYGGDPSALVLMGHSSGAFNAISLAVDRRWLNGFGMDPLDLRAVIGLSGPYVMFPLDGPREHAIFGPERGYSEPADHVDGRSPPLLLITGDKDRAAEPSDSDTVGAKVLEKGGVAKVIHYPSLGHADTQNALAVPSGGTPPIMDEILRFLGAQGAAPSPS